MIELTIAPDLAQAVPETALGIISTPVKIGREDPNLWEEIGLRCAEARTQLQIEQLSQTPEIKALRYAYRRAGKDPTRYRGSSEALLRRVLSGKLLYQINTAVDVCNLVSLETYRSIGLFDRARLQPPLTFRIGRSEESYEGIGRGPLNITGLPVFADRLGPFGSPTSDSERTKITEDTSELMMVIISFNGADLLNQQTARATELFCRYCGADKKLVRTSVLGQNCSR